MVLLDSGVVLCDWAELVSITTDLESAHQKTDIFSWSEPVCGPEKINTLSFRASFQRNHEVKAAKGGKEGLSMTERVCFQSKEVIILGWRFLFDDRLEITDASVQRTNDRYGGVFIRGGEGKMKQHTVLSNFRK